MDGKLGLGADGEQLLPALQAAGLRHHRAPTRRAGPTAARSTWPASGPAVFPVGRLDYDAEGAVLFTDDGELANRLAHPRYGHQRVYLVKVKGEPDRPGAGADGEGVRLEDGPAQALEVGVHERAEQELLDPRWWSGRGAATW